MTRNNPSVNVFDRIIDVYNSSKPRFQRFNWKEEEEWTTLTVICWRP